MKILKTVLSISIIGMFILFLIASESGMGDANEMVTTSDGKEKKAIEILQKSESVDAIGTITIHCRVRNNTDKLVSYLDLQATFFDASKKIVGTGIGNDMNLAAGSEKTIDVMAVGVVNPDTYEVVVDNVMYK